MAIITFLLLCAFSLIYLSNSIPKKPPAVEKAIAFLFDNMKYLGVGAVIFGVVDAIITPIVVVKFDYMIVRMLGDAMIVVMALPFCFDKMVEKFKDKMNTALVDVFRGSVEWIRSKDKIVGGVVAAFAVLVFVFVFR